ncbi:MAG: MBL fold metallo-hydrolase [Candidatus Hodarchaeales archaeon]
MAFRTRIEKKNITRFCVTHGHIDHVGGLLSLRVENDWEITASVFEAGQLASGNDSHILISDCPPLEVNSLLDEGDEIMVGKFSFEVMVTPGHTKGSIILYEKKNKILISGDTLFPRAN